MRKLILLAAISVMLIAASSCQKDKAFNVPSGTEVNRAVNTAELKPIALVFGPDRYRIYVPSTGDCVFVGGNCLDDVIIIAPRVSQLMRIIREGGDYGGYIQENMKDLSANLPGAYLQNVVDGRYTLSVMSNQKGDKDNLIFRSDQDIVLVIPFNKK